jgi:uncharacterized membrane protein
LVTLIGLLSFSMAIITNISKGTRFEKERNGRVDNSSTSSFFVTFLVLIASLLILGPEFVYLLDQFGNRMNTVFKFYYQAWILLSLAAAMGVAILLNRLKGLWDWAFRISLSIILVLALTYPILGLITKTNGFQISKLINTLILARNTGLDQPFIDALHVWTLDGETVFRDYYPDDMKAADWLRTAPYGVIAEATKGDASYSDFSHISTYSGLPTVLGWPMHEGQWRGTYSPQGSRLEDIQLLYETRNWQEAEQVIQKYEIRYVFIGTLEQREYRVEEEKFQIHMDKVFQSETVSIYEVP